MTTNLCGAFAARLDTTDPSIKKNTWYTFCDVEKKKSKPTNGYPPINASHRLFIYRCGTLYSCTNVTSPRPFLTSYACTYGPPPPPPPHRSLLSSEYPIRTINYITATTKLCLLTRPSGKVSQSFFTTSDKKRRSTTPKAKIINQWFTS